MWNWQSDYHGHGDLNDSQTIVLEFDRMSEDLMRGMDWTDYELQAALQLLSGNVLKLKEFLSILVIPETLLLLVLICVALLFMILPILAT